MFNLFDLWDVLIKMKLNYIFIQVIVNFKVSKMSEKFKRFCCLLKAKLMKYCVYKHIDK